MPSIIPPKQSESVGKGIKPNVGPSRSNRWVGVPAATALIQIVTKLLTIVRKISWQVIQKVPCTFLNDDNTCQIYEVRPKACREYPHTNQDNFFRRGKLNAKNTLVCPAAFEIVKRLKSSLNSSV